MLEKKNNSLYHSLAKGVNETIKILSKIVAVYGSEINDFQFQAFWNKDKCVKILIFVYQLFEIVSKTVHCVRQLKLRLTLKNDKISNVGDDRSGKTKEISQ